MLAALLLVRAAHAGACVRGRPLPAGRTGTARARAARAARAGRAPPPHPGRGPLAADELHGVERARELSRVLRARARARAHQLTQLRQRGARCSERARLVDSRSLSTAARPRRGALNSRASSRAGTLEQRGRARCCGCRSALSIRVQRPVALLPQRAWRPSAARAGARSELQRVRQLGALEQPRRAQPREQVRSPCVLRSPGHSAAGRSARARARCAESGCAAAARTGSLRRREAPLRAAQRRAPASGPRQRSPPAGTPARSSAAISPATSSSSARSPPPSSSRTASPGSTRRRRARTASARGARAPRAMPA